MFGNNSNNYLFGSGSGSGYHNHQQLPPEVISSESTGDTERGGGIDEEYELIKSGSGSGTYKREEGVVEEAVAVAVAVNQAADENPRSSQSLKRKANHHRHTQHQIQAMETFFKYCPHPDDKQRKDLGQELGLQPLQVKFWFQNKRTQMKAQQDRHDNEILKSQNEKLRAENLMYKEALTNASCIHCGGHATVEDMSIEEHHLRLENARLREEVDKLSAKYAPGNSVTTASYTNNVAAAAANSSRSISLDHLHNDKSIIVELAVAAMEELTKLAMAGPLDLLWVPSPTNQREILNQDQYLHLFSSGGVPKPATLRSESSRDSAVVIINHTHLLHILMNVNQWSTMFCDIVSRASTLQVLSTGVAGNYNGALQVMSAEFQVPSPLVPTRENYFVRYCKQHSDGIWAVVDASLDNLLQPASAATLFSRRMPSGCLIQELPNGYSKVTWIEHVEILDERVVLVVPNIYKPLLNSGLAFGAKRWVATLERQCERLASSMASNISPATSRSRNIVMISPEGRKSMLKLAERMVISFSNCVGASTAHGSWTSIPSGSGDDDDDQVRVMTRNIVEEPGSRSSAAGTGTILLNAATSFWLPVPPKRIFDFLRNENSRNEWDILSNGGLVQEMAHIANGRDPGNCVSLLRVNSANSNQSNMLILQESYSDATGSYVICAPVDIGAMNVVLCGGDSDYVSLVPSGFAILPDGDQSNRGAILEVGSGGSLLTVAFQILVDSAPPTRLSLGSVSTVNTLIKCTVDKIKLGVMMH